MTTNSIFSDISFINIPELRTSLEDLITIAITLSDQHEFSLTIGSDFLVDVSTGAFNWVFKAFKGIEDRPYVNILSLDLTDIRQDTYDYWTTLETDKSQPIEKTAQKLIDQLENVFMMDALMSEC